MIPHDPQPKPCGLGLGKEVGFAAGKVEVSETRSSHDHLACLNRYEQITCRLTHADPQFWRSWAPSKIMSSQCHVDTRNTCIYKKSNQRRSQSSLHLGNVIEN